ncbi:hypothetical protein PR202_ga07268 [Eleusine coracana subsp. coracana]|uniref:F-box protein AT5G49610-like beta-propeller domain-containing protein n=1 Tax=Eleusine coracana subsp. coracana TaxID=191504 RepID=A0AAV5BY45_ELECO|nr:hypothetical protein PR202_ga07268 [Eleusine coracana subsp. coracana]
MQTGSSNDEALPTNPPSPEAAISKVLNDDDLVGEILLRLDFPTCLVRAAASCKSWLRVASDPAVLCRFRNLHPPCLIGFYANTCYWSEEYQRPEFWAVRTAGTAASSQASPNTARRSRTRGFPALTNVVLELEPTSCHDDNKAITILPPSPPPPLPRPIMSRSRKILPDHDHDEIQCLDLDDSKFYILSTTTNKILVCDFLSSSISAVDLPIGVAENDDDARRSTVLSRGDGLCQSGDGSLLGVFCGRTNDDGVMIHAAGDGAKFVFLEMFRAVVFLDIATAQAEKVYEIGAEDEELFRVCPLTMMSPSPVFPLVKQG